jgi:hypothetical protein
MENNATVVQPSTVVATTKVDTSIGIPLNKRKHQPLDLQQNHCDLIYKLFSVYAEVFNNSMDRYLNANFGVTDMNTDCMATTYSLLILFTGAHRAYNVFRKLNFAFTQHLQLDLPNKSITIHFQNITLGLYLLKLNHEDMASETFEKMRYLETLESLQDPLELFKRKFETLYMLSQTQDEDLRIEEILRTFNLNYVVLDQLEKDLDDSHFHANKSTIFYIISKIRQKGSNNTETYHAFSLEKYFEPIRRIVRYRYFSSWIKVKSLPTSMLDHGYYPGIGYKGVKWDKMKTFIGLLKKYFVPDNLTPEAGKACLDAFGVPPSKEPFFEYDPTTRSVSGLTIRYFKDTVRTTSVGKNLKEFAKAVHLQHLYQ